MSGNLDSRLDFALQLARTQGRVISDAFKRGTSSDLKDDGTERTPTDIDVSNNTVNACKARGGKVVSEEGGSAPYGTTNVYVVDPIDGTKDFIEGQERRPRKSTAMYSLAYVTDTPVMGVAHAPLLARPRLYGARDGGSAMCYTDDGRSHTLHVAESATKGIVMVSDGPYGRKIGALLKRMGLTPVALQSAVFKAVAVADTDLVRAFDRRLLDPRDKVVGFLSTRTHLHDHAASSVIVRAAGGIATSISNGPFSLQGGHHGCVMSANERIHNMLLEVVNA